MCGCEVNVRRFFAFRVVSEDDLNKVLTTSRCILEQLDYKHSISIRDRKAQLIIELLNRGVIINQSSSVSSSGFFS